VSNAALRTAFTYDARGNRTGVTAFAIDSSSAPQATAYTYDLANRLLTETNPLSKTTTFAYDAAGRRQTKLDAKGQVTTYQYDAAGRLKRVGFPSGAGYDFDYDALGRRVLEKSPSHERRLAWDAVGQLSHVDDVTLLKALDYTHDAVGQRTSVTASGLTRSFGYDTRGLLQTASLGQAGVMRFGYDASGRRRFVSRPNGVRSEYLYDDGGQLVGLKHTKGTTVLASYAYGYDGNGLRTLRAEADGRQEVYGYDALHRLTRVEAVGSSVTTYGLDFVGNRKTETKTGVATRSANYNPFNQQTQRSGGGEATVTSAWDDNGNLLTETQGPQVTRYVWDEDNRLRQVTSVASGVTDYAYDANGLRVLRTDARGTVRYLLDGMEVLEEIGTGGALSVAWLNHPQAIDESLAFETGGATYYPLLDALNSVMAITDASGQVVREYRYDVYGARVSSTGSGPDVDRGFTGRYHDANGLIEHRDRLRNPTTGGWLQADRAGFVDGPDLYLYAQAAPVALVDPRGFRASALIVIGFDLGSYVRNQYDRRLEKLRESNRRSYELAVGREIMRIRSLTENQIYFRVPTEVVGYHVESAATRSEFLAIAASISGDGGGRYDEFYMLAHSGSGTLGMAQASGGSITADDVAYFLNLAGVRPRMNVILGCSTEAKNLLGKVAARTGLATYGTRQDVEPKFWFYPNSGQIERVHLNEGGLVRWTRR